MSTLENYKQLTCSICHNPLMNLDWTHVNGQPICNDCRKRRKQ